MEILTFDGCPSHEAFLPRLHTLLERAGVDARVRVRRIESVEVAERERFLGSPTLQIDGEDVDPTAAQRTDFGMKCRFYPTDGGLRAMPPDEWVLAALKRAKGEN